VTSVPTERLKKAIPEAVVRIARLLADAGFRSWAVGGCIRDELLAELYPERDVPTKNDWDLATDARPEEVQRCFRRVIPTGIQHGTVTVLMQGQGYEVTTLRGETGYSDGRRPDGVYFVSDLTEDLARRDFTVNAIAYDVLGDALHDPFDGISDLRRRLLRAVGDPSQRFAEDGLRVLRCARLAATLAMDIEENTLKAIEPSLDSYRQVSAERIREEWFKALKATRPSRAFEIMRDQGMLAITAPELVELRDVLEEGFHSDALTVALRCVDLLPADPVLRFAGLVHSLAARLPAVSRGPAAARSARVLASRLRLSNADRDRVVAIVEFQGVPPCAEGSAADVRRWLRQVSVERLHDVFALQKARLQTGFAQDDAELDRLQSFQERTRAILAESPPLSIRDLAVTGKVLMDTVGIAPGPAVGRTLAALLELVLEEPSRNHPEQLIAYAQRLASS
jgi:tRNA nucleotidyltransferase (CCA-adding enzyme)